RTGPFLYRNVAEAPAAAADIAARRAGNCAMIRARSAASKSIQRAISSSERPQPMHSARVGCTTQTRVQGVSVPVSALVIDRFGSKSRRTIARGDTSARVYGAKQV